MSKDTQGFVIAIDGPAASGKGTIVQFLTENFDGINIYTGGLYRALALACLRNNISFEDSKEVVTMLSQTEISLGEEKSLGSVAKVLLNGEDVTQAIRTSEVALGTIIVAQIPEVRKEMVKRQRGIVERLVKLGKVVILDGQDTATHVYPEANVKVFLTASEKERAKRRQKQYAKQGVQKSLAEMIKEINTRDQQDWQRKLHPLSANPKKDGYIVVDSTHLTEDETKDVLIDELLTDELKKKGVIDD